MKKESLDCEGIVDVGLVVVSHFSNPAKDEGLRFLRKVLNRKIKCVIPTSVFVGSYHIMTEYLGIPESKTANVLSTTLSLNSDAFFEDLRKEDIKSGFTHSASYNIEGWDGLLLGISDRLGTETIYSIDKKLAEKTEYNIVNPISNKKMNKYHSFIENLD